MCGAVYCITDMIIFELLKNMSDNQLYLSVIVQYNDERDEATTMFKWGEIPKDIMDIYNYVDKKLKKLACGCGCETC